MRPIRSDLRRLFANLCGSPCRGICLGGCEGGGIRTFVYTSCAKDKEKGYQIVMPSF